MNRSTVLKQHYYTPEEVDMPMLHRAPAAAVHQAMAVSQYGSSQYGSASAVSEAKEGQSHEVDGFYLLEATGSGFPEDAQQALISDKALMHMVEDDLAFFTEMLFIDASENRLPLSPFGAFPKLRELRLACNHISTIVDLLGFAHLQVLDLSYNKLTQDGVQALEVLPNLRDLDLCGNNLGTLHDDWANFAALEKLLLNYNKLEDNYIFASLSSAPTLRHLGVANNFLSEVPSEVLSTEGFRLLETLDVSFNYFPTEASLESATKLPRLTVLQLYGNPMLGPSGEDPMYIYIEGLVEDAVAFRDAAEWGSTLPQIDFVTEIPRKRNLKKGQPLGRQANYRDFSIVQVGAGEEARSNREWRQKGTNSMFAEAIANKRRAGDFSLSGSSSLATLPDATFLTGAAVGNNFMSVVQNAVRDAKANQTFTPHAHPPHQRGHKPHDVVADDVMQRVAGDMGLINSAQLLTLQERATIRSEALDLMRFDYEEGTAKGQGARFTGQHGPTSPPALGRMDASVPGSLFNTPIGDVTGLAAQPVALKTAMKSLQMALNQPLTSYQEVPAKSAMFPNKEYCKPTRSTLNRQMPRRALSSSVAEEAVGPNNSADRAGRRYKQRGLQEPAAVRLLRQEQREQTLDQIDMVLQGLNQHTAHWSEQQEQEGRLHKNEKETMKEMREFDLPFTGIRSLLDMVGDISQEFES